MINHLLKSHDPHALEAQVISYLSEGWDLQGTLVTSDTNLLGQWMLFIPANSDYKLVVSRDIIELEAECKKLIDDGWRFWYSDQRWDDRILQWMERPRFLAGKTVISVSQPIVVSAEPVTAFNFHLLGGGARSLPYPLLGGMSTE